MPRYFLEIAYDGTDFHGWQRQPNANTVQEEFEAALRTLLKVKTPVVGCGRTDTGVHAEQYFLHLDAEPLQTDHFVFKLNNMLPQSIGVKSAQVVDDQAHARFSATERAYRYDLHTFKDPFAYNRSAVLFGDLDAHLMNQACKPLLSATDFASFCKAGSDVKTTTCDVRVARWEQHGSQFHFHITADRFLRNMVRAIVGTMIDVGRGKTSVEEFARIIAARDRSAAGKSAHACGLYLTRVEYPFL